MSLKRVGVFTEKHRKIENDRGFFADSDPCYKVMQR